MSNRDNSDQVGLVVDDDDPYDRRELLEQALLGSKTIYWLAAAFSLFVTAVLLLFGVGI